MKPQPIQAPNLKKEIWRCLIDRGMTQRKAAQTLGVSRYQVRQAAQIWLHEGWVKKDPKGGYVPTKHAPKSMRVLWADPPEGSPLQPLAKGAQFAVPGSVRVHRGKLKASLARGVEVEALPYWEGCKASRGLVYHRFVLPCKTEAGFVGVPVQVIQPKDPRKPFTVVVQSANIMARAAAITDLGVQGTLSFVRDSVASLLASWLGEKGAELGALSWVGLDRESLEVAQEAKEGARVGGDVQRDFVAVDKSDSFTPFRKEEEQTLEAFVTLRRLEAQVDMMETTVQRMAAILERVVQSGTEQGELVSAILEKMIK